MKKQTDVMDRIKEEEEFINTAPELEKSAAYHQGFIDALNWVLDYEYPTKRTTGK